MHVITEERLNEVINTVAQMAEDSLGSSVLRMERMRGLCEGVTLLRGELTERKD